MRHWISKIYFKFLCYMSLCSFKINSTIFKHIAVSYIKRLFLFTVRPVPAFHIHRSGQSKLSASHRWPVTVAAMFASRSMRQRYRPATLLLQVQWSEKRICPLQFRWSVTGPHTRQGRKETAKYASPASTATKHSRHDER